MKKTTKKLLLKHLKVLSDGYKNTLKERKFQDMAKKNPRFITEHRKHLDEVDFLILEVKEIEED